jgi:hypothetical protein
MDYKEFNEGPKDKTGLIIGIGAGVGICAILGGVPVCIIVILMLLGPSIGEVFADIVTTLQ